MNVESLPVGYRFLPRDTELIVHYLINKILNRPISTNAIKEIVFYDFDAYQLPIGRFSAYCKANEAYFFTHVKQERTTKSGHWESSGPDEPIMYDNKIVGFKRLFVFYSGEERSNWIMHEYRVNPDLISANAPNKALKSKIDSYVICKIQLKEDTENFSEANEENASNSDSYDDETSQWASDTEMHDED
ncbi:hypothetical protein ACOSQ2_018232 [Xanthoceras sorbifolium]